MKPRALKPKVDGAGKNFLEDQLATLKRLKSLLVGLRMNEGTG